MGIRKKTTRGHPAGRREGGRRSRLLLRIKLKFVCFYYDIEQGQLALGRVDKVKLRSYFLSWSLIPVFDLCLIFTRTFVSPVFVFLKSC